LTTALITGTAGQDGILLGRLLLGNGYRVIGTVTDLRRSRELLETYVPAIDVRQLDVRDRGGMAALLEAERPEEIYNLAALSSVGMSWSNPWLVTEVNALAVLGLLESVLDLHRRTGYSPRICQASSSEMFGLVRSLPQTENSPHHPRSPYGTAKSFAHHTAVNYRESYDLYVATTILFNHESPLRLPTFVTRKITSSVAAIALGRQETLTLGRTDIRRDWSSAADIVVGMTQALQPNTPDDYCIASGASHSLLEFVNAAFEAVGIEDGESRTLSDPALLRPADVPETRGDPSKARQLLGWQPRQSFSQVVQWMVRTDLERLRTGVEHNPAYLEFAG
jgi:GDPmannose 4,6-dehydratase